MAAPPARRLLILLVAILLIGFAPSVASRDESYSDPDDGISYVLGGPGSGRWARGWAYDGQGAAPFSGCALVQVREDQNLGQARIVGYATQDLTLDAFVEEFEGELPAQDGGIADNLTVDGSLGRSQAVHPATFAGSAGWGKARLIIGPWDYRDPATDAENWSATFEAVRGGFRDESTNGILRPGGEGFVDATDPTVGLVEAEDLELHLWIESPEKGTGTPVPVEFKGGPRLATGEIAYDIDYFQVFRFNNTKLEGRAAIDISVFSSPLAPQPAEFSFTFLSPRGKAVANVSLAAPAGENVTDTVEFPLVEFGFYELEVRGSAVLGNFYAAGSLTGPEHLLLNFWWEDVEFRRPDVMETWNNCTRLPFSVPPARTTKDMAVPPRLNLAVVALAVGGCVLAAMFLVKLFSDESAGSAWSRGRRQR